MDEIVLPDLHERPTGGSPYLGTTAEGRSALLHDYQMKYDRVSW